MRLWEFDYKTYSKKLIQYMKGRGYKKIGKGADAIVFGKPEGGVVKIIIPEHEHSHIAESVFLAWYAYCKQHKNNPHLPKFGKPSKFKLDNEMFLQIPMENLKNLPQAGSLDNLVLDMARAIDANQTMDEHYEEKRQYYKKLKLKDDNQLWKDLALSQKLAAQNQSFLTTLVNVVETGNKLGFSNDVGTHELSPNVMLRGKTLVITDPWTD